jgi:hypothetical protein
MFQIILLLPVGYFILKTFYELYYLIENLEATTIKNYNYLKSVLQKHDTDYNFFNTNINNINNKLASLKLHMSQVIGEINRIKYNMDDLYKLEDNHYNYNINEVKHINDKLDCIDEDMKIMKSIYSITINELKDEIKTVVNNKLNNDTYNTISFDNIINTTNNIIKFNSLNQIIKNNMNHIGTNYFCSIDKSNYKNIDEKYKTCSYKCNNLINYKISLIYDGDNIIVNTSDTNYLLINISFNINLIFYNSELISSAHDICQIIPNQDIDNEYPKSLKGEMLEAYNKIINIIKNNNEIVKKEINKFIRKKLMDISLEPLIQNFLLKFNKNI